MAHILSQPDKTGSMTHLRCLEIKKIVPPYGRPLNKEVLEILLLAYTKMLINIPHDIRHRSILSSALI